MLRLEICLQKLAEIKQAGSVFKHLIGQGDMIDFGEGNIRIGQTKKAYIS